MSSVSSPSVASRKIREGRTSTSAASHVVRTINAVLRVVASKKTRCPSSSCVHTKTGGLKLEMSAKKRWEGCMSQFSASNINTTKKKKKKYVVSDSTCLLPVLRHISTNKEIKKN